MSGLGREMPELVVIVTLIIFMVVGRLGLIRLRFPGGGTVTAAIT